MSYGKTVFAQIMDIIPDYELGKSIDKYNGDKKTKKFFYLDQIKVISSAQLTGVPNLRIVEATLTMFSSKLYHASTKLTYKSTLAEMNEKKSWLIYRDFAYIIIERTIKMYANDYFRLGIKDIIYAFDSSMIELCIKLCP